MNHNKNRQASEDDVWIPLFVAQDHIFSRFIHVYFLLLVCMYFSDVSFKLACNRMLIIICNLYSVTDLCGIKKDSFKPTFSWYKLFEEKSSIYFLGTYYIYKMCVITNLEVCVTLLCHPLPGCNIMAKTNYDKTVYRVNYVPAYWNMLHIIILMYNS